MDGERFHAKKIKRKGTKGTEILFLRSVFPQ
jgi:hypothetical protein